MAELAFDASLKLATKTLEAIDAATLKAAEDGLRPHLGASLIGTSCARALWYTFRWCTPGQHEARMLRLFARGHREEDNLAALLKSAGIRVVQVDHYNGKQYSFSAIGGHFGGSMDGACVGVPDAPKAWHVLEFKTSGAKAFNQLAAHGVKSAKPLHWAQMQMYMAWTGMERALYMAVCKDDDRLHLERIDADKEAAKALVEKAQRIITASEPPEGISTDASYFECKFCDHQAICHGTAAPIPTCRSCAHATPELDGNARWSCARHGKNLTVPEQKQGCQAHRVIPILLRNWAEVVDANEAENWIAYRMKDGSGEFLNGADGYSSEELHACVHKTMLTNETMVKLRTEFNGRVMG